MEKILFLTNLFPKILNSGAKLRDYYIIQALARKFEVSILSFEDPYLSADDAFLPCVPRERCYIVKGPHEVSALRFLQKRGLPLWSIMYYSKEMKSALLERVASTQYRYIHISHSFMAHYATDITTVPCVIDHHNVKTTLYQSALQHARDMMSKINYEAEYYKWVRYEREVINHFRSHIACSEHESALLKEFVDGDITVVSSGVDAQRFHPCTDIPGEPNILFAANLHYFPNREAIMFFYNECFPRIKKAVPQARFHVVGSSPTRELRRLLGRAKDIWHAYDVEDIRPYYAQSAVVVVPILSGAGTRLKIPEAMAAGVPVVTTTKGCEGLDVDNGEGICIADDPKDFADAVIRTITDSPYHADLRVKARDVAQERFDWSKTLQPLRQVYCAQEERV